MVLIVFTIDFSWFFYHRYPTLKCQASGCVAAADVSAWAESEVAEGPLALICPKQKDASDNIDN